MAQIQFKGKQLVQNHHLSVEYHELVPKKDKSLTKKISLHDNLIIHGNNLKALKALLPTYAGKVKCIYIDPPYNTGNEKWAYNDNVSHPMFKEWLGKVVDKDDLTRHDKWLCMMTPRLKLLRELLSDNGVIFVSIDDNEGHHLRMLMDEIFGEEERIAILPTVTNLKGNQDQFGFAGTHEYVVVYGKNPPPEPLLSEFNLGESELEVWDQDEIGYYKKGANLKSTGINAPREKRPNLFFPLYINSNNEVSLQRESNSDLEVFPRTDGEDMSWRWSKTKISQDPNELIVVRDKSAVGIYKKQRPKLGDLPSRKPKTIFYKPEYSSGNGTAQMKLIFGNKKFNNPKPLELIRDLIAIGSKKDSIVLDSFAGSGTTGHAVLDLNKEDGGNRKFILVELEDYADKITAERVRRVIKGVPMAKDEKLKKGLGGSFSYFELGKPIELYSILSGKSLPTYLELARYIFYTATGEEFNEKKVDKKTNFIGESKDYEVYLFYKPDLEYLKNMALTLDRVEALPKYKGKKRLVFAPTKYMDQNQLGEHHIAFAQLPFEIYKLAK